MTETLFYHLERRDLNDVLPGMIEKSLARGWRAVIRTDSAERSDALDTLLWTYNDQSFLAHAQAGDGEAKRQPVLITTQDENPNGAQILFLVGGIVPASWKGLNDLARIVLMFDGRDPAATQSARDAWKDAREAGHAVTYWKETPSGKFEKQG